MVKTIRFVALGDSLTFGFILTTLANQPYTSFLGEYADDFLREVGRKDEVRVSFVNRGVNGDLTSQMLRRFRGDVAELRPDYVIVFGGANDIGWGVPTEAILANIRGIFDEAAGSGIRLIGCTVSSVLGWDAGIAPRFRLNTLIKRLCDEREAPCADLFAATCDPDTKRLRAGYSSDGLHLNPAGYRKIAETIFTEAIKPILAT